MKFEDVELHLDIKNGDDNGFIRTVISNRFNMHMNCTRQNVVN